MNSLNLFIKLSITVLVLSVCSNILKAQTRTAPYLAVFDTSTLSGTSFSNGWMKSSTSAPTWTLGSGSSGSSGTGPSKDHTTGTGSGKYVFLETSSAVGTIDSLISPLIDVSSLAKPGLAFWYHRYGGDMGDMYVLLEDSAGNKISLDTLKGQNHASESADWTERVIDIAAVKGHSKIRVIFVGKYGGSYLGDMAVDDIKVYNLPNCLKSSGIGFIGAIADSANISWTSGGASAWVIEWDTAGFTQGSGNSFYTTSNPATLGKMTLGKTYDVYIKDSCGGGNGSSQWSAKYTFKFDYCFATASASVDSKIDSVMVGTMKVGSSLTNCEAYTDNTGIQFSAKKGEVVPISVRNGDCTPGTVYDGVGKVYIDFNHNLAFESSEEVFSFTDGSVYGWKNGSFTVPVGADTGVTRMRVLYFETSGSVSACTSLSWGEVEEYSFRVIPPAPIDAGISQIFKIYCGGNNALKAVISNFGSTNLVSATVNWSIKTNSGTPVVQTPVNWTGNLPLGSSDTFNLSSSFNLLIANSYEIEAYTTNANSGTDGDLSNDTSQTGSFGALLSGTYTVGGTSPDFSTPALAASRVSNGVCGTVKFLIRSGTYGAFQLNNSILGQSSDSIVFMADPANTTAVLIKGAASENAILLRDQKNIFIENLSLEVIGNYGGVTIYGNSRNITVRGCKISLGTNTGYGVLEQPGSPNRIVGLYVIDNEINGGLTSIYCRGVNSNTHDSLIVFTDNKLMGWGKNGIFSWYLEDVTIENNELKGGRSYTTGSSVSTDLYYCRGPISIRKNDIVVEGPGTSYGIWVDASDGTSGKEVVVTNNMSSLVDAPSGSSSKSIYILDGDYSKVQYNSAFVSNGNSSSAGLYVFGGSNCTIENNTAQNGGLGFGVYLGSAAYTESNNNGYAPKGTSRSTNVSGIGDISVDPYYHDWEDLHSNSDSLNNVGKAISGITTDIDNQTRSISTPDIGADEFTPTKNISLVDVDYPTNCYSIGDSVGFLVVNSGPFNLNFASDQFSIHWSSTSGPASINGNFTVNIGSLNSKDSMWVYSTSFSVTSDGTYGLKSYVSASWNSITNNDTINSNGIAAKVGVTAALSAFNNLCANASNLTLSGGSPTGGTYSGTGVTGNTFSPSTAGVGTHTISYSLSSSNGCGDTATQTIRIDSLPTVSLTSLNRRCANSSSLTLTNGSPSGGVYSGNGISSGIFEASSAGAGKHVINYVFTDANNCSGSDTTSILVDSIPNVQIQMPTRICAYDSNIVLNTGLPTGGVYSGDSVKGNIWNPGLAGSGNKSVQYKFTDARGCSDSTSALVLVDSLPTVSFTLPATHCLNAPNITLNSGTPSGGSYSGMNVVGPFYVPSGPAVDTIHYSFTDANTCRNSASATIRAVNPPIVGLTAIPSVCEGSDSIIINQGTPVGGRYSGKYLNNGKYGTMVSGTENLKYEYTDINNCTDSNFTAITIDTVPTVVLLPFSSICINTDTFSLTGGFPDGGMYSGRGVSNGVYDASVAGVGSDTIKYVYLDKNNCGDSLSQVLITNASPMVSLTDFPATCSMDSAILLNNGTPAGAGGVYSGTGVIGGVFTPDTSILGSHVIKYTYTDNNNCVDSASKTITVEQTPVFTLGPKVEICGKEQATLTVPLPNMTYLWSSSQSTQSVTVQATGVYSVTVTDPSTTAKCEYTSSVRVEHEAVCVGISEDLSSKVKIRYYPNPTNGYLNAKLEGLTDKDVEIKVLNAQGQVIIEKEWKKLPETFEGSLDLNGFTEGVYFIHLSSMEGNVVHQVVLSK